MIQGSTVILREWRVEDLSMLTGLRNDVALQGQLLARPRGSSADHVKQWLAEKARDPSSSLLIIATIDESEAIGYVQLSGLGGFDRNAELGICIRQGDRGRGRGLESINLICDFARSTWAVRKMLLRVRADNDPAIACYAKAGFQKCALLRAHAYLEGSYRDIVMMERLLDDRP